ncbi:PKD domain-containing protein, partial [Steroidobacter sp.]|uniref:PKD domain-containing protein n=1 Tax=Steroidobacter sp. TaxID=1978227 RepID=UPI001A5942EF
MSSRSESIRRCRQLAIGVTFALSLAACGGGGGGGGGGQQQQAANVAPTVQAGTDQSIELPKNNAQLTGSATDDSTTSTLTYTWSATSGPSGVTFGTANAASTTVTFPAAGSYVLTLSVSDGSLTGTDTVSVTVAAATYPAGDTTNDTADHGWTRVAAADVGMSQTLLDQASTYATTSGTVNTADTAGMIVRRGRLVHSWGDIDKRYDMKSTTKSIGGIALGVAIDNGSLALSDVAQTRYSGIGAKPASNITTGWLDDITVQQLATHTAGFIKTGGWYVSQVDQVSPTLQYQPGTTWFYSDGGLNWLAELLTTVFNQDLTTVLSTEVWTTLGLNSSFGGSGNGGGTTSDVHWRDNQFRDQTGQAI